MIQTRVCSTTIGGQMENPRWPPGVRTVSTVIRTMIAAHDLTSRQIAYRAGCPRRFAALPTANSYS